MKRFEHLWRRFRDWGYWPELVPVVAIIGLFLAEFNHLVRSAWEAMVFSSADFLTLPAVAQSLALHEPFHWVFSSQNFLFPEAPIYSLASLLTPDFRLALILNSLINCLALYALLRWITGMFAGNVLTARLYALLASSSVLVLSLLENRTDPGLAIFFIMSTTYYGVILMALASLGLNVQLLRRVKSGGTKDWQRLRWWLVGLATIALLTSVSNPLYILQFVAPLALIAGLAWLLNVLSWRTVVLLLAPQLVGSLVAVAIRQTLLKSLFSPLGQVGQYLHFGMIGDSLRTFSVFVSKMQHGNWQQKVELKFIVLELVVSLGLFALLIKLTTRARVTNRFKPLLSPEVFVVSGLAGLTPLIVIAGSVATGNALTRYLVPLIIFPLLAGAALTSLKFFERPVIIRASRLAMLAVVVLALSAGLLSHPVANVQATANYYTADERCLDQKLADSTSKVGVAQYWRARGLQLNSRQHLVLVQTLGTLDKFTWLYNSADYHIYHPTFVVVDKVPAPAFDQEVALSPNFAILADRTQNLLGAPTAVYDCPSFYIYTYPPSNPGYTKLNASIRNPNTGL